MKKYLLAVYNQRGPSNPVGGGIDPILEFINTREDVFKDWTLLFRQVIIVISDADSQRIANVLHRQFPHSLFLVTLITEYNGWLPEELWNFLRDAE